MTTPTARERAQQAAEEIVASQVDSCCDADGLANLIEPLLLAAERVAAEAMRERCARVADPEPLQHTVELATSEMWARATGYNIAAAIRALPLEVDDAEG